MFHLNGAKNMFSEQVAWSCLLILLIEQLWRNSTNIKNTSRHTRKNIYFQLSIGLHQICIALATKINGFHKITKVLLSISFHTSSNIRYISKIRSFWQIWFYEGICSASWILFCDTSNKYYFYSSKYDQGFNVTLTALFSNVCLLFQYTWNVK